MAKRPTAVMTTDDALLAELMTLDERSIEERGRATDAENASYAAKLLPKARLNIAMARKRLKRAGGTYT